MINADSIATLPELALAIQRRRMSVPAIFVLELCKPLIGPVRELYSISESLQSLIFGGVPAPCLKELLASSAKVEELILLLEKGAADAGVPADSVLS